MLSGTEVKQLLLMSNRPDSLFASLPKEVIVKYIAGFDEDKVLAYAVNGEHENLFKALSVCPSLMFARGNALDYDGKLITMSPLYYLLEKLDQIGWRLCYVICGQNSIKYPELLERFFETSLTVQSCVDLEVLKEAYKNYLDLFDESTKHSVTESELRKAWLQVGKAQATALPRHMLREMCLLSPFWQSVAHDVVLMSLKADAVMDEDQLHSLGNAYPESLILTSQEGKGFVLWRQNMLNKEWIRYPLSALPFKEIFFPTSFDTPFLKCRERDSTNINFMKPDPAPWPWENPQHITIMNYHFFQTPVFLDMDGTPVDLLTSCSMAKLGNTFTLARGNSSAACAIDMPKGGHHYLNMKANADLTAFMDLYNKRKKKREAFLTHVLQVKNANIDIPVIRP